MRIFKVFIKDYFFSLSGVISVVLTIISILEAYFEFFEEHSYMTEILFSIAIICSFLSCYKLYSKIAFRYPDAFIEFNNNLKFNDFSSFFKIISKRSLFCRKCNISIIEDENSFMVDNCWESSVTLKVFHKICIRNLDKNSIELYAPKIQILSINNNEDKFFINRLKVSLEKLKFSNERYFYHWEYIPQWNDKHICRFPYKIDKKEEFNRYLYIEIKLDSLDKASFEELLNWIRIIKLKIEFPISKLDKKKIYSYVMEYNFKRNLIQDKINEKVKESEELKEIFK